MHRTLGTPALAAAVTLAAATLAEVATPQRARTVKVFVLAGQSNMEGKAQNVLLEHQATDPDTAGLFAHLRDDGEWIVRDDVFINYLDRNGGLTIGYGSPGRTGAELEFGWVMGDHFREPVLLIKAAWGGHSLVKLFRSPSAGMPGDDELEAELAQVRERVKDRNEKNGRDDPLPTMAEIRGEYGKSYRNMLAEVRDVFENARTRFPALRGRKLELAGFVWFQGWNDQYGGAEAEYESNMRHFIADLREDLDAPGLPFVIGVMGQNGSEPSKGAMKVIQDAQLAMDELPGVRAVRTDVLVDEAAEALYPTWKDNQDEWKLTGSDHKYHYLGSAIWFTRIGRAMGDAMVELIDEE